MQFIWSKASISFIIKINRRSFIEE